MNRRSFFTFLAALPVGVVGAAKAAPAPRPRSIEVWSPEFGTVTMQWGPMGPPYLVCDGSKFDAAMYPPLAGRTKRS